MASEAGLRDSLAQGQHEGRMRIGMTGEAPLQLEMGLPLMAFAAFGNVVGDCRRMTLMAILTGQIRAVGAAQAFNILDLLGVAFDAVAVQ